MELNRKSSSSLQPFRPVSTHPRSSEITWIYSHVSLLHVASDLLSRLRFSEIRVIRGLVFQSTGPSTV